MLYTIIKKNSYQDSVNLMLLTKELSAAEGIEKISVMMGTPANKEIFANSGLYTEELESATPNDICIVIDTEDEGKIDGILESIESFLKNQSSKSKGKKIPVARTWDSALRKLPDANLAIISIPGEYAAEETSKALEKGLNVFLFSDNVSIEDEKRIKEEARTKGLLVMGPDCGTGIIGGLPLAFANVIEKGNIGIVGASGTGIQEISTIISRKGYGITQAIGTGGRDLSAQIEAITAIEALKLLASDDDTDVIVFISKPPAPEVRDKVIETFKILGKPVVANFLGDKKRENHDNVFYTHTLEDTALKTVEIAEKYKISEKNIRKEIKEVKDIIENKEQRSIKGLYCGGTLAAETGMIIRDYYGIEDSGSHDKGMMLHYNGHEIIDLGDDFYTQGRPHPMIDPSIRVDMVYEMAKRPETAVILLDNVIGYGGHEDMAGVFAPVIKEIKEDPAYKKIVFIASITGTENDPQKYSEQYKKLEDSGAVVCESNAQATRMAVEIIKSLEKSETNNIETGEESIEVKSNIINTEPVIINIGLGKFAETVKKYDAKVIQYNWAPTAGGDKRLAEILKKLR